MQKEFDEIRNKTKSGSDPESLDSDNIEKLIE